MRRRGLALALGIALLAATPAGARAAQSKCEKLDATHDLAPAKRVKLVERKTTDPDTGAKGTKLVGCVLPRGKLVDVAAREEVGTASGDYRLDQVAGHHVLVTITTRTPFFRRRETQVVDLKRDHRYTVADRCTDSGEHGDFCDPAESSLAKRAFVNSSGQAAAVVWTVGSDIASVTGFSPTGRRVDLDTGIRSDIPTSSLEVDGHVARWTNRGAAKSARLPGRTACERLKAKHDLAPAKSVKLVERPNEDGGTDLVGCVLPSGRVRVVASGAKQPGLQRTYRLWQVAGHEVLVRADVITPYGDAVSTYVYDLERGSSYTVAETCFDDNGVPCEPETRALRAFVNARGQAAAIVSTKGSGELKVLGFRSTGESEVLDTGTSAAIPPSSLSLDGRVVHWTHSGTPRSATLSG